jgi:hypothetical protein
MGLYLRPSEADRCRVPGNTKGGDRSPPSGKTTESVATYMPASA